MRFLQGLMIPGITAVMTAYLAEEFQGTELSRMMTAYISGGVLGGFSGRFISGYVSEFFGWRSAFLVLAAMTLLGAVAIRRRLPPSRSFRAQRSVVAGIGLIGGHMRNRRFLSACLVGFCILFTLVGGLTYAMVFLSAPPFSLSPRDLGNVFLVYLVGAFVTPLSARAMGRFGLRSVLLGSVLCSATGLAMTFLPVLAGVVAGLAVFSTGVFCAQAAAIRQVAAAVSEGRSLASGIYSAWYYAGGAVGTWLCGWAYVSAGWYGASAVVVLVLLLAAGIAGAGWSAQRT